MMNAVHPRSDKDQIQNPLDPNWQAPVRMMKEGCGFKRDEENDQHNWADSEEQHGQREESDGKNHFAEMKSRGGAHIEVEVGVMDVMKSPEERYHMHGPVPPPIRVVHQNEGHDHGGPGRNVKPIQ